MVATTISTAIFWPVAVAVVGGLLSLLWDWIKRRRESDIESREAFYTAYAEFFTTWKLWDAYKNHQCASAPSDVQWRLLEKAEDAEASFEALLVKLTAERKLSESDCRELSAFRQAHQTLREKIRSDKALDWWTIRGEKPGLGHCQYSAFKALSGHVAALIVRRPRRFWIVPRRRPSAGEATVSLLRATGHPENWVATGLKLLSPDERVALGAIDGLGTDADGADRSAASATG
jgi:hypothetical protein